MRDEWGGSLLYVKQSLTDVDTRTQNLEDGQNSTAEDGDGKRQAPSTTNWDNRLNLRGGATEHSMFHDVKSTKCVCTIQTQGTRMVTSWRRLRPRNDGYSAQAHRLCIRGGQKFDVNDFVDEDEEGGVSWGSEDPWGSDDRDAKFIEPFKDNDMPSEGANNDTNIDKSGTECASGNQNNAEPTSKKMSDGYLDTRLRGGCQVSDVSDAEEEDGVSWGSDDPWGSEDDSTDTKFIEKDNNDTNIDKSGTECASGNQNIRHSEPTSKKMSDGYLDTRLRGGCQASDVSDAEEEDGVSWGSDDPWDSEDDSMEVLPNDVNSDMNSTKIADNMHTFGTAGTFEDCAAQGVRPGCDMVDKQENDPQ
jgi:hypothetical protein